MNIVQITDLHIVKDKEGKINNFNTFQAASEVVRHVAKHQKNIDYLILTGDISDDGTPESYENLREILSPVEHKVLFIPGNHDSLENLNNFRNSISGDNKFIIEDSEWIIFMFDTKKHNSPNGQLKTDEIDSCIRIIDKNPQKNVIMFLHHHPIMIGSASMDKMIIENAYLLLDIVKNNDRVKGVFWGHIHNVYESKLNQALLLSTPSTCFQSLPKSKTFTIDRNAKPGYRVIRLNEAGLVSSEVVRI